MKVNFPTRISKESVLKYSTNFLVFLLLFYLILITGWLDPILPFNKKVVDNSDSFPSACLLAIASLYLKMYQIKKQHQDERYRYIELYKLFTSNEMRHKRKIAWNMIKRAIQHPNYSNILISNFFIDRYINEITDGEKKEVYKECGMSNEEIKKEPENVHLLNDFLDFYNLLSSVDLSKESLSSFDFCYDSWRPLLYWFANELDKRYQQEINIPYSARPSLRVNLHRIDKMLKEQPYIKMMPSSAILGHPLILIFKRNQNHN